MNIDNLEKTIQKLRNIKPIILCLTNFVTMDFMANSLLALGASPIMSVCEEETEELISMAHSLVINMGTLDKHWLEHSRKAIYLAQQYKKPIMFDPVGSGATVLRTSVFKEFLPQVSIIRGNASEILSYEQSQKSGVDSKHTTDEAKTIASQLAKKYHCTITVSGAVDFVTDGEREHYLSYGSHLMPLVTGMGCTLTAAIAAFRAVVDDNFEASRLATAYFGLCGMSAELKTQHPGTFRMHFIDALHHADFQELRKFKIEECI